MQKVKKRYKNNKEIKPLNKQTRLKKFFLPFLQWHAYNSLHLFQGPTTLYFTVEVNYQFLLQASNSDVLWGFSFIVRIVCISELYKSLGAKVPEFQFLSELYLNTHISKVKFSTWIMNCTSSVLWMGFSNKLQKASLKINAFPLQLEWFAPVQSKMLQIRWKPGMNPLPKAKSPPAQC